MNKLKLSAKLQVVEGQYYVQQNLNGFADLGIFPNGGTRSVTSLKVVGEMKKDLRNPTAFQEKDQLLIEMTAIRQARPSTLHIKGFLTDIFAMNIAVQDIDGNLFVAPRVCDSRSFWIRLLFLLCDLSVDEFDKIVTRNAELAVDPNPTVEERNEATRKKGTGGKPGSKTKPQRRMSSGGKESHSTKKLSLNFKQQDIEDEFEELFTDHYRWAHKLYGELYLCDKELIEKEFMA